MHQVLGENSSVVTTDGSGRSLNRVGRTHQGSNDSEGVLRAFEHCQHRRATAHEGDKVRVEGLLDMFGVMLGQGGLVQQSEFGGDNLQAFLLEAVEDTSDVASFYGVRLTDHKGSVHGDQTRSIGPTSKPFERPSCSDFFGVITQHRAVKSAAMAADSHIVFGSLYTPERFGDDRGASLVEYALALALVLLLTIGALSSLTTSSGTYLSQTGTDIGSPPEHIADLDPSLPDAPSWIGSP